MDQGGGSVVLFSPWQGWGFRYPLSDGTGLPPIREGGSVAKLRGTRVLPAGGVSPYRTRVRVIESCACRHFASLLPRHGEAA
jgi:hypothetical protein